MICNAYPIAHPISNKEPNPNSNLPSVQFINNNPPILNATPIRIDRDGFFLKNKPNNGTKTIYSAVMKPDLPALSNDIPNCCSNIAIDRDDPHTKLPIIKSLILYFFSSMFFLFERFFINLTKKYTMNNEHEATNERSILNVNGETYFIPNDWKTKAIPHIIVPKSNNSSLSNVFLFM